MPIQASRVPEVREDLKAYLAINGGNFVGQIIGEHLLRGGQCSFPAPECRYPWDRSIEMYQDRLRSMTTTAELFHVSAEMTEMCAAAGLTMPGYKLHRDDIPAESGLIVFDAPIGTATHETIAKEPHNDADRLNLAMAEAAGQKLHTVEVVAALWRFALCPDGSPGVLVVTFTSNYDMANWYEANRRPDEAKAFRMVGWLGYHDETVLPFGDIIDEETDDPDNPRPIRNESLRTLIATWLIMGQDIVTVQDEPLPRQTRRSFVRKLGYEPKVQVVKLRQAHRPRLPAEDDSEGDKRRYDQHRWVVRAHWRNQYYPSQGRHKPKYIPEHIKGPEDAPFKNAERVFDLRR